MFAIYMTTVLAAVSAVSGTVLPRESASATKYPVPSTYTQKWLEPYDNYHIRYTALNCQEKHNTKFFDQCCHPMLKWEKLEKARPAQCRVAAASTSATLHTVSSVLSTAPVSTHIAIASSTVKSSAATASATASADECTEDDENCECVDEEDDDDEECEEGEEDCVCEDVPVSSSASASTAKASPTSSRSVVLITSTVTASPTSRVAIATSISSSSTKTASRFVTSTRASSSSTKAVTTSSSSSAAVVTSTPKATQTPSSTVTPTTSKTAANVPLTQQTSGSFSNGNATFYLQGGAAGACGEVHEDTDLIAAIDSRRYGDLDKKSLLCGLKVKVTNHKNGKSVVVTIKDACPTCDSNGSIDLSKTAFLNIATEEEGEVPVTVEFV